MTSIVQPICMMCSHFHREAAGLTCDAFAERISDDIIHSRLDHTKPIDGDHGIQFEQDSKMPKMEYEFYKALLRPTANA